MAKPLLLQLDRNFLLLWQGQQLSVLGSDLSAVALSLWVVNHTDSPTFSGLLMTADSLPTLLILPIAGALCDRCSRKKILISADLIRGILYLLLGLCFCLLDDKSQLLLPALLLHSFSSSAAGSFFHPAIASLIPDLLPKEQLPAALAMDQTSTSAAHLLGTGIGGALYQLAGAPLILAADGFTFLFSAVSAMFIKEPPPLPVARPSKRSPFATVVADLKAGGHYLWHFPGMRTYLLSSAAIKFCIDPIFVALPFFLKRANCLNAGDHWLGWIMTGMMVGGMIGSWLGSVLQGRHRHFGDLVRKIMVCQGLGYALLGLTLHPWLAMLLLFFIGGSFGLVNNYVTATTQFRVAPQMRGKTSALMTTFIFCLSPIAFSLAGLAVEAVPRLDLLILSCGFLVTLVNFLACQEKHFRGFLTTPFPEPEASCSS